MNSDSALSASIGNGDNVDGKECEVFYKRRAVYFFG